MSFPQKLLLRKRRSHSETRIQVVRETRIEDKIKSHMDLTNVELPPDVLSVSCREPTMGRRKTTAELIKEAKTYLSDVNSSGNRNVGGVKLINTKRPITPREPGRLLFGKVALIGRPPSAFSMRYLQHESSNRSTKNKILEPLKSTLKIETKDKKVGLHHSSTEFENKNEALPKKLPTLEGNGFNLENTKPVAEKSLENNARDKFDELLDMLKEHAGLKICTEETENHVHAILVELYERVSKNGKNYKRGTVLAGLYGLVECTSPKILLGVARAVLALRVTGSNLTGACKLIFKVARNEKNDYLFYENDILELLVDGLGRATPLDDPEACIYGYGAIRFLTTNTTNERIKTSDLNTDYFECLEDIARKPVTSSTLETKGKLNSSQRLIKQYTLVHRLAKHGAVELMVLHLQMLNESTTTKNLTGPPLHSLYQLSAALRALADLQNISVSNVNLNEQREQLKLELACPHLIRAAEQSMGELEVQANIVRTLSVLSEDIDCCHAMQSFVARLGMLLGPCCEVLGTSPEKLLSLCSRLGYILGNIMAKYDSARLQFYHNDVAMEYLLNVLKLYSKDPLLQQNTNGDTANEVLVKLTRVVANMSVNAEVGFGLGYTADLGNILLELLHVALQDEEHIKSKSKITVKQELLNATLGALHNLCFYQDKCITPSQVLISKGSLQTTLPEHTITLCEVLKQCISVDIQVEIVRVLGNLTRNEEARQHFCKRGGMPTILQCLTRNFKQSYELKACAIGVLVNLLGDAENRIPFFKLKGTDVLVLLLRGSLDENDWFLAAIISQAFWNLLIDLKSNDFYFEKLVLNVICDLLTDALDEEQIFEGCSSTDPLWEEFAIVGTDLLERLHALLEYKDYLESSSETNIKIEETDVFIKQI